MKVEHFEARSICVVAIVLAVALFVFLPFGKNSTQTAFAATSEPHTATCWSYYETGYVYVGFVHMNTNLCHDGTHVWQGSWGPDCSLSLTIGFTGSITWCGIYNNGGTFVDIGANFYINSIWGGQWSCYYRVEVNSSGNVTKTFGGC